MEGGRQQPLLKRYTYILGVVAAYWTVSITLVFVNKSLLSGAQKLDAPLFITCYQCVITVAACYVLRYHKLKIIQAIQHDNILKEVAVIMSQGEIY